MVPTVLAQRYDAAQCGVVDNLKKALWGLATETTAK